MKRILFIWILLINITVFATSGNINEKSVFECNGKYYGSHGNPIHFHEVIKKNNKWVINGGEVEVPSCYIKPLNEKEEVIFSKCVDGDTAKFIINNQEETVRFLAIDTPEVKHGDTLEEPFGNDASNFTCNKLTNAKKIVLEYDANSDIKDRYGRILAFVFTDDILLQKELIKNGLAKVNYIYGDYNYVDELRKEEAIAKKNALGIWSFNGDIKDDEELTEDDTFNIIRTIFEYIIKIFDLLWN